MQKVDGINKVAVIGAGLMGFGIGLDFARAGYETWLYSTRDETARLSMSRARTALDLFVEAGIMTTAEADAAHARLHPTTNMEEAAKGADYVSESVLESLSLKREIFEQLDRICPPPALLTSNTSSFTTTSLVGNLQHPERCCVAHYFQPPHFMPLVEVVAGQKTSPETIDRTFDILTKLRKKPVVIRVELPRHAGNRIQNGIALEARQLVDSGACTPQMVDDIIKYSFGRRMANTGYFIRTDLIGYANTLASSRDRGEEIWGPLKEIVEQGHTGMRSGKGFYDWPDHGEAIQRKQDRELLRWLKEDYETGRL